VSTILELLERKSSSSGLESREYCRRDSSRWPHGTLYQQTLALTLLTSCGRSVGIVRSRTQITEFSFFSFSLWSWAQPYSLRYRHITTGRCHRPRNGNKFNYKSNEHFRHCTALNMNWLCGIKT
jgi:hypothetical protein